MGENAFLSEEFSTNPEPDLELVTTSGYGKNGALSVIQVYNITIITVFVYFSLCRISSVCYLYHSVSYVNTTCFMFLNPFCISICIWGLHVKPVPTIQNQHASIRGSTGVCENQAMDPLVQKGLNKHDIKWYYHVMLYCLFYNLKKKKKMTNQRLNLGYAFFKYLSNNLNSKY